MMNLRIIEESETQTQTLAAQPQKIKTENCKKLK